MPSLYQLFLCMEMGKRFFKIYNFSPDYENHVVEVVTFACHTVIGQ